MKIKFDHSFNKKVDKLKSKLVSNKLIKVIEQCEKAKSINEIPNIKKMVSYKSFYRIKISDFRIGIELIDYDTLLFITIAHRKDIYSKFP
ncbi:MAG: type II toxin-antitoxin system RelE/ParE family toxin [Flavobacteriia bacterium]|nr:type II toxin-antitoxin system RelE/ParE family toxin [Flavobacteriia bacterium]